MKIGNTYFKVSLNGVEWANSESNLEQYPKYFLWFDPIEISDNRTFGYEKMTYDCVDYHAFCFWYFAVCWSF